MEIVKQLAKRALRLKENQLLRISLKNPRLKERIIQLNTQEQLYKKGIDSEGRKLKSGSFSAIINDEVYAMRTIFEKELKGQPTDRVTLNDTGDFYNSFRVNATDDEIIITAKTMKQDNDLLEVWGEDILGLTDENLQEIIDRIRVEVVYYLNKTITP